MKMRTLGLFAILCLAMAAPMSNAYSGGIYGQGTGCGGGYCHGSGTQTATVSMSGQPTTYTAGSTYTLSVSVTGGPSSTNGGFALDIDKGSLSSPGTGATINTAANSATHANNNYRSWSVDWTAPSTGSGVVSIDVAGNAVDGNGYNTNDEWDTTTYQISEGSAPANTAPTLSNLLLSPATASTTDTLVLSYTFDDVDGDTEAGSTIQWFRNSVLETSLDGMMSVSSSQTEKGENWNVEVTPNDGTDFGTMVASSSITIGNSAPILSSVSIGISNPGTTDDLSVVNSSSDADAMDTLAYEYRWYLDGNLQSSLDGLSPLPSFATRNGDSWEIEMRVSDGTDSSAWMKSSPVVIGSTTSNTPPSVDSVTITPSNPTTETDLTALAISSDADMDSIVNTEYRWMKNGIETDVESQTLSYLNTMKGDSWSVSVRVNDGTTWSSWQSSPSTTIENTAPVLQSASLSASQVTGQTNVSVDAQMTDVDVFDSLTFNIQWYLDDVVQPQLENVNPLPSSQTSKGQNWAAVIHAFDGSDTSSESETLYVDIINSEPSVTATVSDSINSQEDITLIIESSDIDSDSVEITSITWFRNGFREGSLDNATTVPSSYLGPGQIWSVEVLATDGEEAGVSSTSITISNAPPTAIITVLTEYAYAGERVQLTASTSSDPDNRIVAYQWSWSSSQAGQSSTSGTDVSFLMPLSGSVSITLVVTDESGATDESTFVIQSLQALPCPSLTSSLEDENVNLAWAWNAQESADFNVYRNGVLLGQTNQTSFTDTPSILGLTTYKLTVTIGDRVLESSCQVPSTQITVDTQAASFDDGPSTTLGFGLGSLYTIIGILFLVAVILRRGD
ncbi:PKD domain-containing protein [Candidatus Poseidoniales archaeon]|nr:PKD domain-containing protein [Candidatus Poseidoniales archaeon]